MTEQIEAMFSMLDKVQKLDDQTKLLPLNEAIEVIRNGEAAQGFAVVANELRNLSKSASS